MDTSMKSVLHFEQSMSADLAVSIQEILKVGPHLDTRLPNDVY